MLLIQSSWDMLTGGSLQLKKETVGYKKKNDNMNDMVYVFYTKIWYNLIIMIKF